MAYVSKTWVDRDSQYPTRRIIVHPDLTEEQVTVRRDEGIITTQGDVFDANTMNNLEARIAAGLREKQDQLTAGTGIDITNNVISATGGGGASALDDLTDVDINSPTNGQALVYDAGNDVWVNGSAGGGGSSTLAGLTDVALATPTDGQALCYDAATQKWKNSDAGGAGAMVEKTATGAVASFPDGADNLPLKSVVCAVRALQSGSGDPSPANVRAISGFTGLNLYNQIGNFWDEQWEVGTLNDTTGQPASSTTQIRAKNFSPCKGGASYYVKVGSGNAIRVFWYDASYNYLGQTQNIQNSTTTAPDNASYLKIRGTNAYGTTYGNDISINCPSTDTAYHAYVAPTVYPVTWQTEAGTVYGCLVNPVTGVMKITWMDFYFDGSVSVANVGYSSSVQKYYTTVVNPLTYTGINSVASNAHIISDKFLGKTGVEEGHCYLSASGTIIVAILPDQTITTKEQATTWFQNNPTHFVYELAQPITVQLTPTEAKSLLGANNIWHDANGYTTVTYRTETAGQILDVVQENTGVEDLNDVSVSNVSNGQVLKYNSTSQKWENANESGGGAEIDDTTTAQNKVWSSSKTSSELAGKQGTLTAGTGIAIDSNNVISATGGGGGGSYTAGEKIRIDSQDVISADPQYNIIWNGDSLADVKSRHLVGGLPYGFSKTNTASGFDIQNNGFKIDGDFSSDDHKHIVYEPPVSFNDPTWRSGVSDFILELYWTDDPQAEPVIYTKEVLQLEVNGTPETLTLNGIELSVNLASGTYGGLIITIDDTSNADGDIWITGLNLTVKNSTGMLWTPHDLAIQEYVASVAAPLYVELNGTLTAGATTVTLSNSEIRTTSTFDIYTDVYGVNPTAVAVSNGSMTLTFEAQQSAINVKVRVT